MGFHHSVEGIFRGVGMKEKKAWCESCGNWKDYHTEIELEKLQVICNECNYIICEFKED